MDTIWKDLGAHAWIAALIATLVFLGGLAQQGKVQPFLAKLSPWGKTFALLALASCGVAGDALQNGLGWTVALGRALSPIAVALFAHYVGVPSDPAATAQKTADVAAAKASESPAPAKLASKIAGVLSTLALCVLVAFAAMGCKAGTLPPVSTGNVTGTIDGGCTVVGILDSSGATAADVCETLAPILAPIIATIINDLGGEKRPAASTVMQTFVPLTNGGAIVGHVRADIASAVQAKLDAVSSSAAAK